MAKIIAERMSAEMEGHLCAPDLARLGSDTHPLPAKACLTRELNPAKLVPGKLRRSLSLSSVFIFGLLA